MADEAYRAHAVRFSSVLIEERVEVIHADAESETNITWAFAGKEVFPVRAAEVPEDLSVPYIEELPFTSTRGIYVPVKHVFYSWVIQKPSKPDTKILEMDQSLRFLHFAPLPLPFTSERPSTGREVVGGLIRTRLWVILQVVAGEASPAADKGVQNWL